MESNFGDRRFKVALFFSILYPILLDTLHCMRRKSSQHIPWNNYNCDGHLSLGLGSCFCLRVDSRFILFHGVWEMSHEFEQHLHLYPIRHLEISSATASPILVVLARTDVLNPSTSTTMRHCMLLHLFSAFALWHCSFPPGSSQWQTLQNCPQSKSADFQDASRCE